MRRCLFAVVLAGFLLGTPARAHIGSLNVIYEGQAGTVPVRVIIRPPGVVPGLADIDVRVLAKGAQKVTVLPVHWRAGLEGAPPPDVCRPVEGDPDLYHAQLWLMSTGAYSVHVQVETAAGSGKVIVPVNSLATTRLGLSPGLTVILVGLGLLLFLLAVSVVGAAVRESVIQPGELVSNRRKQLGRAAMIAAMLILILALTGGRRWWLAVDGDYRNNRMFKSVPATTMVRENGDERVLRLVIDEKNAGRTWSPLVPDHGKLMHLFLIQEPGMNAFAHLHPVRQQNGEFESALPKLSAGHYRVYADVTHETGFSQTLTSMVALAASTGMTGTNQSSVRPDPDDSVFVGAAIASDEKGRRQSIGDGLSVLWDEPGQLRAGRPTTLKFRVVTADGELATLEPYMGMLAHLIISRDDGAVFTHLHPAGSISVASQQVFQLRAGEKPPRRISPEMMEKLCQVPTPDMLRQVIAFPYEVPRPGRYKIWFQVKALGQNRTAAFEVAVGE